MKDINFKTVIIIVITSIAIAFLYNTYNGGFDIIPKEPEFVDESILDDGISNADDSQNEETTSKEFTKTENMDSVSEKNIESKPIKDTAKTTNTIAEKEKDQNEEIVEKKPEKKKVNPQAQELDKSDEEFGIISYQQIKDRINNDNFLIIDARSAEEYAKGHIGNAVNIFPYEDDEGAYFQKIYTQPRDKKILIYCTGGTCDLSHKLAKDMKTAGFENLFIYEGGWDEWEEKSK